MTGAEISEIVKQITGLVTAIGVIYAVYQNHHNSQKITEAKAQIAESKVVADATNTKVFQIEANTNSKMDALLSTTNAASFRAGQEGDPPPAESSVTKES